MKSTMQCKFALAVALILGAAGSVAAAPGDDYPDWGNFGDGRTRVAFDLGGSLDDSATDSVVGSDGSMYIAGTVADAQGQFRIGVAKLRPDGTPDPVFSGDGRNISFAENVLATSIALSDSHIYVAGFKTVNGPDFDMVVCRFNRDNGNNALFPNNGNSACVSPDAFLPGTQDIARDIIVQPDGKFVIAGTMEIDSFRVAAFARFNADGTRDQTFGNVPNANLSLVRSNEYAAHDVFALTRAADGTLIAAGSTKVVGEDQLSALVIRLNENGTGGTPEFVFQRDGSILRDTVLSDVVAVDDPDSTSDALILSGKVELSEGKNSGFIARAYADMDALDITFGTDDGSITAFTLAGDEDLDFTNVAVEPSGAIVALGARSSGNNIVVSRFDAFGEPTTQFGTFGSVVIDFGLAGGSQMPAAISALGHALYVSGRAFAKAGPSDLDFVAAKLQTGEHLFADGFESP